MAVLGAVCLEKALPWAGCNCVWKNTSCKKLEIVFFSLWVLNWFYEPERDLNTGRSRRGCKGLRTSLASPLVGGEGS